MPYKTDKEILDSPFLDGRVKLLPCQRERLIRYHGYGCSQRHLARIFNISRRLVQFTTNEEMLKRNKQAYYERGGWKIYYDRQEHNNAMKFHRRKKYQILKEKIKAK